MLSFFKIEYISLVVVCLSLKGNIVVGSRGVSVDDATYQPLHYIPEIEKDDKQLLLLLAMNVLMPLGTLGETLALTDKDKRPDRHGFKAFERNVFVD